MIDLISRQAAIEMLKKLLYETALVNSYDTTISDVYTEMAENRIETWVNLIPPAQQWIPVSERLPEEDGSYLVFGRCASYEEDYYCFISNFDTGCERFGDWVDRHDPVTLGFVDSDFYEQDCVLAWMPLPEPFKEEDNERV